MNKFYGHKLCLGRSGATDNKMYIYQPYQRLELGLTRKQTQSLYIYSYQSISDSLKKPPTVWALFSVFMKRVNYIPASNIKSCNVQIKISVYFFLRYLLLLSNVSFQENNSSYSMFYSIKHTCMSEGTHIC